MIIKNFAGVIFVKTWITTGILSIGKINPDKMNDGRNETNVAIWKATCCVSATDETKIPKLSDAKRNIKVETNRRMMFPLTGIPNKT